MSDWEDMKGEDGTDGMEYDRVFGELFSFLRAVFFLVRTSSAFCGCKTWSSGVFLRAMLVLYLM